MSIQYLVFLQFFVLLFVFFEIFNISHRALLLSLKICCLFHLKCYSFILHGILKTLVFLFHLQLRPMKTHDRSPGLELQSCFLK